MTPQILAVLSLQDDRAWLKDAASQKDLLLAALTGGLVPGKELAWAVEHYLMALYRADLLALIDSATPRAPARLIADPVFRAMLRYDVLANHLFEGALAAMRRQIAARFGSKGKVDLALACDLALHFHFTGFLTGISQQEIDMLARLRELHATTPTLASYAVVALYGVPPSTDEIALEALADPAAAQLFTEHQQARVLARVAGASAGSGDTIGQQYNDFPYPLWRPARAFMALILERLLKVDPALPPRRRLVAGCGTGRQPLISLTRDPLARVLVDAIDVSAASLHYARTRLADFSPWIHLQEADIAQWCADHPRTYDNIECIGVLHHTPDPRRYLQALIGAAVPGGKITLGLYSMAGRQEIMEVREWSRGVDFGGDLRKLRANIIRSDLRHKAGLMARRDFYTRSEFKDLANNNREKNYTPASLAELLQGLPLRITWFKGVADCTGRPTADILETVAAMERAEPSKYAGMYLFTVQTTN